jgi:hypothetical protein
MIIKNILKPNFKKIILTIIIAIIAFIISSMLIIPYICKCADEMCSNCPQPPLWKIIITWILAWPGSLTSNLELIIILQLIYFYIISSLILFIISKKK